MLFPWLWGIRASGDLKGSVLSPSLGQPPETGRRVHLVPGTPGPSPVLRGKWHWERKGWAGQLLFSLRLLYLLAPGAGRRWRR